MTAQLPIQKERLEGIARGEKCYTHDDVVQVARALLAAHEQEPVGTFRKTAIGYVPSYHEDAVPLYTHPAPVPAVPDEIKRNPETGWYVGPDGKNWSALQANSWNACRAAMLNGGKS